MTTSDVLRITRLRTLMRSGDARRIREEHGVSLAMAGQAVGVSPATVHRWEAGTRVPRPQHALAYVELIEELEGLEAPEAVPA